MTGYENSPDYGGSPVGKWTILGFLFSSLCWLGEFGADKAAALAVYAKQAEDIELEQQAARIRANAMRRAGELLKQFNASGNNQHKEGNLHTQKKAAEEAGFSEHQTKTAVRIANIPEAEFEKQVET